MLPPSDHGVSEMTIPEEEEEELETEGTEGHGSEQDGLSSLGGRSTHASDELEGEYHEHRPSQDMAMHAVEGGDDARRSKSKIKRGARKIKKWLTTSKSRSQDAAKAATTMAMVASPHSSTGKKMSISSHSSTLSSSSSLLAAGDDKVHPFQRLRRPSSQRDQDTTPPLESNLPSKDLRRESKALIVRPSSAAILPSQTNNIMVAHSNVPFPEFLPETRPRHTRSASLQTKNAVTLYNKGGPRRHSSQTFTSSTTTSSQISRRSLDSPEDQLRRSLQRIAHFNQRFRQLLPGPDQPCPPIRARSSSLPRSFSPALRPLAKSPSSSSPACNENSDNADGGEVDEREHGADASLERHCPKVRSPLSSGAAMAAAQFEQEYQMHLEAQAEHEQAVQEMKQKRRSVWVDIVDLELPESMPPSRSVVAKATTTPPTTPTVETASPPWHGPMYWNAEAATSLQSIPSMPSSSPANSRRNSLVSLHGDYEPENTLTDEYEIYQHDDEEEDEDISGDEYDYEYDDEEEEEGDEEDERSAYPPFMTKWDMEIASEDKQHTDDWIHQHADAHHRNDTTNQSHLSLPSTRRSSTIAESISTNDPMSPSARLTGFIQYKTMIPNNSNAALGKRFFWAMEAPSLLKPEANTNNNTNTDA
ncbi:hypothetical protein BGW41_001932 [Actinomortierella wolfii]|nr:hypothetical protein BGW41_001932 [Actinomortierella wolfii]